MPSWIWIWIRIWIYSSSFNHLDQTTSENLQIKTALLDNRDRIPMNSYLLWLPISILAFVFNFCLNKFPWFWLLQYTYFHRILFLSWKYLWLCWSEHSWLAAPESPPWSCRDRWRGGGGGDPGAPRAVGCSHFYPSRLFFPFWEIRISFLYFFEVFFKFQE
jgi:hypothetical protein